MRVTFPAGKETAATFPVATSPTTTNPWLAKSSAKEEYSEGNDRLPGASKITGKRFGEDANGTPSCAWETTEARKSPTSFADRFKGLPIMAFSSKRAHSAGSQGAGLPLLPDGAGYQTWTMNSRLWSLCDPNSSFRAMSTR